MIIIEFFGPPCSGKTFCADFLIKKNKNFISSNLLIPRYSSNFVKLNTLDKASLKYFQLIKFIKKIKKPNKIKIKIKIKKLKKNDYILSPSIKNKYSNLMVKHYRKVCKKLYKLFRKQNYKFDKFYLSNLNKIKDKKIKLNYQNWYEESMAKYYIAKNLKGENKIIVFDEGLLQRLFHVSNQANGFKKKVNYFLEHINGPDYAIYLNGTSKSLFDRSLIRAASNRNVFVYNDFDQIKKYKNFFKYLFKKINHKKSLV